MTGLEHVPSETFRESCIPVLETARLILRAPRLGDAKVIAALANDRHIAENTARIPHPYKITDAKDWIAGANKNPDEEQYVITLSGHGELEVAGGKKISVRPGSINLVEDVTGKGHITRTVGNEDRVTIQIPLTDR